MPSQTKQRGTPQSTFSFMRNMEQRMHPTSSSCSVHFSSVWCICYCNSIRDNCEFKYTKNVYPFLWITEATNDKSSFLFKTKTDLP